MKLTKEECLEALNKIKESFGCDMAYYDLHNERDCLEMLIHEHFELVEELNKMKRMLETFK
ncbi:hypothetical protein [Methanobrevibacter sp.]|uniref:hypothetical protein n=1 Tax=Methanobrevibacter sp. TaxID=66852 RepID=UPI00388FFDD2